MSYISREKLLRQLYNNGEWLDREHGDPAFVFGVETALETIADTPDEDVEPVVHAHWVNHGGASGCSKCLSLVKVETPRCPYCGARMYEEEVDDHT